MRDVDVPVPDLDATRVTDIPPLGDTTEPTERDTAQPEQKQKRRYRKRKAAQTDQPAAAGPEVEEAQFAQALAMGFDFGGRIASGIRGDHWLFKPEETAVLGQVWASALIPYMGSIAPYTPFLVAIIVTAGTLMPRVQTDRAINGGRLAAIRSMPALEREPSTNGPEPLDLRATPLGVDTLGGAAMKRNRRNRENPPGIS